mmetsp:Transcript_22529/g.27559  ORF Transcript_22529/g.27559 Transcript_22529/m.27559 type:complete len:163 (+) Transcript_22529:440-928(+)
MTKILCNNIRVSNRVAVVALVRDGRGQTLVHAAARGGDQHTLKFILNELKSDVEKAVALDMLQTGRKNVLDAEVEKKIRFFKAVNCLDRWHRSALHWSVLNNNLECTRILLQNGGQPDQTVKNRVAQRSTHLPYESPREIARRKNLRKVLELFHKHDNNLLL